MTTDLKPVRPGLVFLLCFLAGLCEGYDLVVAGITAPKFAPAFGLEHGQLGMVFSASTLGLFFGALIGGRIADHVGRRAVLIVSLVLLGIFSIGSALVTDVNALLLMRFLTGLGLGGTLPNLLALTHETSRPESVTARVTIIASAMPFGGAILGVLMVLRPDLDWQTVFMLGGFAPIMVAAVMLALLPESPVFLARKQGAGLPDAPQVSIPNAIAGDGRLARSLLIWISSFLVALTLYLMINWLPSLLVGKGFARPDAARMVMFLTFGGASAGLAFGLMARLKSRWALYIATWAGMALSVTAMAFSGASYQIAAMAAFGIGFFISGGQFLLYALTTTLYPGPVRGTGVGFAVGVGRLGAVAGPLLAGLLLTGGRSIDDVLLAVVPLLVVALIAALPLLSRKAPAA